GGPRRASLPDRRPRGAAAHARGAPAYLGAKPAPLLTRSARRAAGWTWARPADGRRPPSGQPRRDHPVGRDGHRGRDDADAVLAREVGPPAHVDGDERAALGPEPLLH